MGFIAKTMKFIKRLFAVTFIGCVLVLGFIGWQHLEKYIRERNVLEQIVEDANLPETLGD